MFCYSGITWRDKNDLKVLQFVLSPFLILSKEKNEKKTDKGIQKAFIYNSCLRACMYDTYTCFKFLHVLVLPYRNDEYALKYCSPSPLNADDMLVFFLMFFSGRYNSQWCISAVI